MPKLRSEGSQPRKRWGRAAAGFLLHLAAALAAAQTTGTVDGTISDEMGAPLPGAAVTLSGDGVQGLRSFTTNTDGRYRFPAIPPGVVTVAASLDGFGLKQARATVTLDGTATVNLRLAIAVSDSVVVTGETPTIDQTSTTTGTNYSAAVISRLPTARNYADIVKSNPGVSTDRGDTQGRSLALAIYGATSAENQWIIDGVNTTDVFKGVQGKAINNEFVQEVEVKTGGYQAEYGRALGGVINVITKSGGNTFHGDGFLYYDSTDMAAEKEFRPGDSGLAAMRVADGERFDFGMDLGGFLLRDRLWFFGAYNRVIIRSDVSRLEATDEVPTEARFPLDAADNLYSGKLTWNIGNATSVVGSVFADPSSTSGAAAADPRQGLGLGQVEPPVSLERSTWYSERSQGGTDFGLRLTQLFGSAAIATLQGSYHRDRNGLIAPEGVRFEDGHCAGGTPDNPCAPPPAPNAVWGGYGHVLGWDDNNASRRWQYSASVTAYAGDHEVKAGGDYQDGASDLGSYFTGGQYVALLNEGGQDYFAHTFYTVGRDDLTPAPGSQRKAHVEDYGVFLQDSWRVASNLTLNLGLRWDGETTYDYADAPVFRFNDMWQPRVGVVWDPWRDGATKVYASAGRFSYALPTVAAALAFGSVTWAETYNFDAFDLTQSPDVVGHEEARLFGGPFGDPVDPNLKGWYQDELTIGIERALNSSLTVGLKGTYRVLRNVMEDRCDLDYFSEVNNLSQCGMMNPGSSEPISSGNVPTCDGLNSWECTTEPGWTTPEVSRIYRGIELLVRQQIGNALWLQASYIYSSLRGNYDGGVNQGAYGQTTPGFNPDFDYPQMSHNAYGALALDRPNRFRLDSVWNTPWRVSVGLQAFAETGGPLNRLGYLNQWYGSQIFLDPRGSSGRLPTYWGANLSLGYPISVGPATVTLQAYLFNIFDQQIAVARDEVWSRDKPDNYPEGIYDPNQPQDNQEYGYVLNRAEPRVFRAAVKVSF